MSSHRFVSLLLSLSLSGCVFGYYSSAPDGFSGDYLVGPDGAAIFSCDLGPNLSSGSTPGTCIGRRSCKDCNDIAPGTKAKVTLMFVHADSVRDVSLEIREGAEVKVVHSYGNWDEVKRILVRPAPQ